MVLLCLNCEAQSQAWHLADGSGGNPVCTLDIYRANPDTLYATGAYHFMQSTDRGATWAIVSDLSVTYGALCINPGDPQVVYATSFGRDPSSQDVYTSTDGGRTWTTLFIGRGFATAILQVDPTDHKTIYAGVGPSSLWRSTDGGTSWDTIRSSGGTDLCALAISSQNDSILYEAFLSGIYKSTNRGQSWNALPFGYFIQANPIVLVDPSNSDIVYVTSYCVNTTIPAGVFKSTDGGKSWQPKNSGLSYRSQEIITCAIDWKHPNILYLGCYGPFGSRDTLLFRSTDGGESWRGFSNGLPISGELNAIAIDTMHDRMYLGVYSSLAADTSGIYVIEGVNPVREPVPAYATTFVLYQNYPNPFNSETVIRFEVAHFTRVIISVRDVLGREVATLVDEMKAPGIYTSKWGTTSVPSGVYFYSMEALGAIASRKMILVK